MFRTVTVTIIRSLALYTHRAIHTGYVACLLSSTQHNLYDIYRLLCLQCRTPYDGQSYCPKHVEFHSKNKLEKLVYLVGFVIRKLYVHFIVQVTGLLNWLSASYAWFSGEGM